MKRPFYRQDDPRRRPRIPLERTPPRRTRHAAEALLVMLAIVCSGLAFWRVLALVWGWVF